eukprot:4483063-Alexandrium_andersonii.AAC.1
MLCGENSPALPRTEHHWNQLAGLARRGHEITLSLSLEPEEAPPAPITESWERSRHSGLSVQASA